VTGEQRFIQTVNTRHRGTELVKGEDFPSFVQPRQTSRTVGRDGYKPAGVNGSTVQAQAHQSEGVQSSLEARFSLRHSGLARRMGWGGDSTLKFGFTWARPLRFDYPQEIQSAGHLTTHDTSKSSDEPPRACLQPATCDLHCSPRRTSVADACRSSLVVRFLTIHPPSHHLQACGVLVRLALALAPRRPSPVSPPRSPPKTPSS
jgi:hypothetical protein